jgi:hypothetical protein
MRVHLGARGQVPTIPFMSSPPEAVGVSASSSTVRPLRLVLDMLIETTTPGTQVEVVGVLQAGDGSQTSSWQCFIDGQQFGGSSTISNLQATNYRLCASSTLLTGSHNLSISFTNNPGGSLLGLDYIAYTPLDSNWEQCPLISTPLLDANVSIGSGWTGFDVFGNATRIVGAEMSFTFTGTLRAISVGISLTMTM